MVAVASSDDLRTVALQWRQSHIDPDVSKNKVTDMNRDKLFRRTVVGVALVALLGLSLSSAAPALKQIDERTPVYPIHNVFDAETRSAIASTGALIVEVGKDYVLVEATGKEKQAIKALGLSPSEPAGTRDDTGTSGL
jgi:hypothetical protein